MSANNTQSLEALRNACASLSTSNFKWEVCWGMCRESRNTVGMMCEHDGGRIYVENCESDNKPGAMRFYVWHVSGDNNPYSDGGKWVRREYWASAEDWRGIMEYVESCVKAA